MSSNLTTEPTAEAGPSVAGPSEAVLTRRELVKLMQEKPDIDLGLDDMPVIRQPGTRMRVYVYCVVFAVYHWIKPNGRLTVEEEIESIVCNLYNKNKITEVITTERLPGFYDHLQNSSERATIVLEGLDEQKTRHFKGLGQRAFDLLLENAWAKDRDENLNGFEGRMISLPWRREGWGDVKKPKIGEHELRDDQAYLIQSLGLRKDSEGKYITSSDALQIASRHYQINIDTISNWRGLFPAFDVLDNMDNNEAIMVRNYIEDPRHWTFFGDKARTLHLKYSREGVLGYPAGTPSPVIDAASQSGLDPVSASLGALSVGATAPAPGMSAPTGSSGKEQGTKGKGRARDPSTESPEGQGSGKGKEVARKKPRGPGAQR